MFRHSPLQVWRTLSLSFDFRSLFLLADDVFPLFPYACITLEIGALDTPNKVALMVGDAQPNAHQQFVFFENETSLLFCSTFVRTITKHNL